MFNVSKALTVTARSEIDTTKKKSSDSNLIATTSGGTYSTPTKRMVSRLDFRTMEIMYWANIWVRSCVDKIVKRTAYVNPSVKAILKDPLDDPTDEQKLRIESIENILAVPNSMQQSFETIRKQIFTDLLIWDAGALELVKDEKGILSMYAVSGDTMRLNVDKRGIFKSFDQAYHQVDNGLVVAKFAIDELLYFMQYPRANSVYGLSPLESLRQTVTAELYAADFNIKRFINDATPRYAVLFDNLGLGQGGEAMQRVRHWWDSELKGNPHKPILVGSEQGSITFEKIGLTNEDMQFQEYSRWLLSKIMAVYHMQAAVLGVIEINQGRINAAYQEQQFKKDAVKPLLRTFSNQFNTLVVWSRTNFGWNDIYLDWDGIDEIDRQAEAKIHEIYLKQGVFTINMVLRELGRAEVPWGNVPYLLNQMVPIVSPGESNTVVSARETKMLGYGTGGDIDFKEWIRAGYLIKGKNIPTGLEYVSNADLKEAISKIIATRKKNFKEYSYEK